VSTVLTQFKAAQKAVFETRQSAIIFIALGLLMLPASALAAVLFATWQRRWSVAPLAVRSC
jgi:hypothetical protein